MGGVTMTFKNKLACSTLTDNQHHRIIQNIEYFFSVVDTIDELEYECKWLSTFVWSLETMSFICPCEREKYLVFIKEKYEESFERIKKRS